ncbi:MAG: hypothetical protein K6A30_07460 [Lachnospiraceae bacterium]|nr:hypothetical protein [Lachnospiraceae bacterium]
MKKISIIYFFLFLIIFAGFVGYVATAKDFKKPDAGLNQEEFGITDESPIWEKSIDDLAKYLKEEGFLKSLKGEKLATSELCSDAVKFGDIEIFWWDLDKLDKDSQEYDAFTQMRESGMIDLYGSGNMMSTIQQGPFGINIKDYSGNKETLIKAYHKFGVDN